MTAPVRLVAFAALLAAVLLAGFGLGRLVGPLDGGAPQEGTHGGDHRGAASSAEVRP